MKKNIDKIKAMKEYLENQDKFYDMDINYILYDNSKDEFQALLSDNEGAVEVHFSPRMELLNYDSVEEWEYNYDYYFLDKLSEDLKISYMSFSTHYTMWKAIKEIYKELEDKAGLYAYLKYCKENNITNELIDEKLKIKTPNIFDLVNISQSFKEIKKENYER